MAKKPDPREESMILIDIAAQLEEFKNGKPIGENARIPVINENFSWKRSFQNCWTGWPNDGKSTFFQFMTLMKSVVDSWKWCIWPPEMLNAIKGPKGKMIISASDIVDELVFMKTGRNPYKHFERQYGVKQMKDDEYIQALEWVQNHYIFVNPKERKFKSLIDCFRFIYEVYGVDGFLIDPFKNLDHSEEAGRFDLYLDRVFSETKEFSLETDTSFNWIAHPRNDKDPKNPDGSYKLCSQFMLAGGASWNNNMDGIFSIYRPYKHKDPKDPRVTFFNLKQRKQQLVGRAGMYDKIEFDFLTNRFYFDGHCPIDGSYKEPIEAKLKRDIAKRKEEAPQTSATKGKGKKGKSLTEVKREENIANATEIPFENLPADIEHELQSQSRESGNQHETLF